MNYKGKKVIVFGLGVLGGGIGTAEFFAKRGANVLVTDLRKKEDLKDSLKRLSKYKINYVLGRHREEDFLSADLIVKNPGIPSNSPFLKIARENHIPIEMAESLFLKLSPTKDIIGITGTRGKSTTSVLIYEIMKKAGFDVYLAGNFKNTSTLSLLEKIDENSKVVLELSSWQLESFGWCKASPHVSLITNIYPDHLNRYSSMKEYINDKKNIFKFQNKNDYLILNREDDYCQKFAKEAKSKIVWFSKIDINKDFASHLYGNHNRENIAAVLRIVQIYKIEENITKKVISSFSGLPFRLQKVGEINGVKIFNDSTSTTPIAGIKALSSFPKGKVILIAGGNSKNIPLDDFVEKIKTWTKALILIGGTAAAEFKKIKNYKLLPFNAFDRALFEAYKLSQKDDIILFSPGLTHLPDINEFKRGELFNHAVKTLLKKEKNS